MKEESVIWEGSKLLQNTMLGPSQNVISLSAKKMKYRREEQYALCAHQCSQELEMDSRDALCGNCFCLLLILKESKHTELWFRVLILVLT